jgi:3-methylfumaryl-CoA hydratase
MPDEVLLFRYSALTFNAHRIHYDEPYATGVEGYAGLLVHGPLLATLMLDHLRDRCPGRRVAGFAFRAVHPAVMPHGIACCAAGEAQAGDYRLWVRDDAGVLCMEGTARLE